MYKGKKWTDKQIWWWVYDVHKERWDEEQEGKQYKSGKTIGREAQVSP